MSEERRIVFVVLLASVLLTVGVLTGTALAQGGDAMPRPTQHKSEIVAGVPAAKQLVLLMDKDKDGRVSKQEWMRFMEAEFDRLDTNHDGYVDVKDMEKAQIEPVPNYRSAGK